MFFTTIGILSYLYYSGIPTPIQQKYTQLFSNNTTDIAPTEIELDIKSTNNITKPPTILYDTIPVWSVEEGIDLMFIGGAEKGSVTDYTQAIQIDPNAPKVLRFMVNNQSLGKLKLICRHNIVFLIPHKGQLQHRDHIVILPKISCTFCIVRVDNRRDPEGSQSLTGIKEDEYEITLLTSVNQLNHTITNS